jgi:Flp pilus assembly secretin CpaC
MTVTPPIGRWISRPGVIVSVALGLFALTAQASLAAEPLPVTLDQAKIVKLPEKVATIVIGNPLIADVTVQSNGMMVVTGKGYGVTNLMVLDRAGAVLVEHEVQVQAAKEGVVVVYRGAERESYSCVPNCEQRITLGDAPNYFEGTLNQAVRRTGQAQGSGSAGGAAAAPAAGAKP